MPQIVWDLSPDEIRAALVMWMKSQGHEVPPEVLSSQGWDGIRFRKGQFSGDTFNDCWAFVPSGPPDGGWR